MFGRMGVVVVLAAFAVGGVAGWLAERAWRGGKYGNVEVCKYGNMETANDGRAGATNGRASRPATADAAAGESKVSEAELAALRDKAASLDKELKALLDARKSKSKADAQEMGGRDSQKGKLEVSEDEALEKCRTYGELKQRYPNVWRKWRGRSAKHAECVLKKYDKWRECVSNLDISSMTDGERETHARMVEIYDRKCALVRETELCDDDEMTIAQFKENNDEVDRLDEESRGLKVAERGMLLRITAENLGRRLGWQEADTAEFAETLRAVGDVVFGDTMN